MAARRCGGLEEEARPNRRWQGLQHKKSTWGGIEQKDLKRNRGGSAKGTKREKTKKLRKEVKAQEGVKRGSFLVLP